MPDSLKSQIKSLWHKGKITDAECKVLLEKLDAHDREILTRKKGVWIPNYLNDIEWGYKCSNCKETWLNEYNYCPSCGCKMEVSDEN